MNEESCIKNISPLADLIEAMSIPRFVKAMVEVCRERDIYDEEIEYLNGHPERITLHWSKCTPLFAYASKERHTGQPDLERPCFFGCLTQIRADKSYICEAEHLTGAIVQDDRLPNKSAHITIEQLPAFAEWQRKLDKELNREPATQNW